MLINVLRQVVSRLRASLIYMPICRRSDIDRGRRRHRRRSRKGGAFPHGGRPLARRWCPEQAKAWTL